MRDPDALLRATVDAWTRWAKHIRYDGPQTALVRRSAITLKLLDYFENGALVAKGPRITPSMVERSVRRERVGVKGVCDKWKPLPGGTRAGAEQLTLA